MIGCIWCGAVFASVNDMADGGDDEDDVRIYDG